jgi:hypothetical protein
MRFKPLAFFAFKNYAQTPTPLVLDDRVRVFIAERDGNNRSYISYADLDIDDPTLMLGVGGRVLGPGPLCGFDQDGQMPSFSSRNGDYADLWYSGWLALPSGYHNSMGLAISRDGGRSFVRSHPGPVMDRTETEPYLCVTPCIVNDHGPRMWYITGLRWEMINGRAEPIYGIAHAQVIAGSGWERDGKLVVQQNSPTECFSRPWVLKQSDGWRMWYSYRGAMDYRDGHGAYKIGYATSDDSHHWVRRDSEFILPRGDFDSTMQAYPAVFQVRGKTYLLYNGNGFGKRGFGLAVME